MCSLPYTLHLQVSVHSSQDTLTPNIQGNPLQWGIWKKKNPLLKRPPNPSQPQVTDCVLESLRELRLALNQGAQASLGILTLSPPTSSVLGLQPRTNHSLCSTGKETQALVNSN